MKKYLLILWTILFLISSADLCAADETLLNNGDGSVAQIKLQYTDNVTQESGTNRIWVVATPGQESFKSVMTVYNVEALGFGSFVLNFDPQLITVKKVTSLLPNNVDVIEKSVDKVNGQILFSFILSSNNSDNINLQAPSQQNPYGLENIAIAELECEATLPEASSSANATFRISDSRNDTRLSRKGAQTLERLAYTTPTIPDLNLLKRITLGGKIKSKDYLADTSGFIIKLKQNDTDLDQVLTTDSADKSPVYSFNLKNGVYQLEASRPGYMTVSEPVSVAVYQAGSSLAKDFTLTPGDICAGLTVIGSDGKINTEDLAKACFNYRKSVNWSDSATPLELKACDMDRDGTVSIDDIGYVISYWLE